MSLVDLNDIKTYMGITGSSEDALLAIFQAGIEQSVINYCDVSFARVAITNEIHDGSRADILVPRNAPIASIEQLVFDCRPDGTLGTVMVPGTDFYFDENAIKLVTRPTPHYKANVRIDYTHGYDGAPPDVKLAVYEAVKSAYQMRKRNAEGIGSRSKQGESESYKSGMDARSGLPISVAAKLQTYKILEFPNINTAQRNT